MEASIFQLNCSDGGVPKLPVGEAQLTMTGLSGDRQEHPDIHGGVGRALCLYSMERILELQDEGHPIYPGSIGENVTVQGLDWTVLEPGTRLTLGDDVEIEITSYAGPCAAIRRSFADGAFERVSQKRHPGSSRIYARVITSGRLAVGQAVRIVRGGEQDQDRRT